MKSFRKYRLTMLTSAIMLFTLMAFHGQADADRTVRQVAIVTGGGVAGFDETGGEVTSTFGIGVTIYSDGTAMGHFECLVQGIVSINAKPTQGRVNADGSVTFSGFGKVNCPGGPNDDPACQDVTFEVTVESGGGPGVGHFTYFDSFLAGGGGDGTPDPETVQVGEIRIRRL